ncbi:ejaculatory bulb-specific protein 3-like [Venturia canescens]|uniref:ejaculatory bulb-specific protein 3-like n=1 Tax=Venturia canescens TaxID=32260 RepID=UPI001C9CD628|nr:ejaculatory bulb-specific protein 3-like [Venturia canescens]
MSKIFYVIFYGALTGAVLCTSEEKMYTTKYDNINIDEIIKSERLLKSYVGCLLEENPCTPEGNELKKNLPEALTNACASCSEAQKTIADKLAHHLIDSEPEDWSHLEIKYDPTGSYKKLYLDNKTDTPAPP